MSAMVMCPDNAPSSAMFQRYPSPPVSYPFNGFSYNTTGAQHPQDYNQFQMTDPTVQQVWYNAMYGARPDEWGYAPGTTTAITNTPPGMGTYSYRSGNMGLDYSQTPGQMNSSSDSPGDSSSSSTSGSPSNKQLRPPYDWMKKAAYQSAPSTGKTRTKDKYRVVYSDQQRLELEKEFHYSRYITIRRKAELASTLGLSERQVKIWFQNRRAKERKQNKKRDEGSNIMKMNSDLGDLNDENKQHLQQQMNMQMVPHAQHQVQVQSPSPPPSVLAHNPYSLHQSAQIHPGQSHHLAHQDALSPQIHGPVHNQYSSPNHLQLPISPVNGHDTISPTSCSVSPVTIKTDHDATDCSTTS